MSNYRRSREGSIYFFTVVTYQRQPILCMDVSRKALKEVMREVREQHPFEMKACVLLPDHLHAIWELPEGDTDYSKRWALIKKGFTGRIKIHLPAAPMTESRLRRREGAVWQRRFWEHTIRDEDDYRAHFDYIHYNPVKHGLVRRPCDWPHSTFHRYVNNGLYPEEWGAGKIDFPEDIGRE